MTRAAAAAAKRATGATTVFHLVSQLSCSHESGSLGLFFFRVFRSDPIYVAVTRDDEVPRDEPVPGDDAHRPRRRGGGGARVAGRALALQPARRNR